MACLETADGVEALTTPQYALWKEPKYYLKEDDFMPVIATKPHVRFSEIGCVNTVPHVFTRKLHHFVWSKPKDVYKKVQTFAHANEFKGVEWYEKHFKNWEYPQKVKHPKGHEYSVGEIEVPEEFRGYL